MSKGAGIEKAYALIIGISEYKDPGIRRLNYTHADAEGIFKLLTDPKKLGLSADNINILLDKDATLFNIKDAITNWLYKKADKDSVVFIFFAGHGGVEEDPRGIEKDNLAKYLLPYDSVLDNLYASALSNRDFNDLLLTIRSKKLVIFMDSCYSGGVSERTRDVKITDDPYQKLGEGEGRLVIAASQPDQRSYEDSRIGHGVFTYNLLEALSGKADLDNDGYVTVLDAYKYLQDSVPRDAMKLAGGKQEPILRGDITKDFVISIDREHFEKIEKERVLEEKLQRLQSFYDEGKLSGKQYEYLREILKFDSNELNEKNKKISKRINDLLSGNISIPTFLEDLKYLEPEPFGIPGKKKQEHEKKSVKKDEELKAGEGNINPAGKKILILIGILGIVVLAGYFFYPEQTTGSVSVSSSPSGVAVYLDGSYQGITPLTIEKVGANSHTITLQLEGYQEYSQIIRIVAGEVASVSTSLIPAIIPTPTAIIPTPTAIATTATPTPIMTATTNKEIITNSIGMEFVLIPAGEFDIGSPSNEIGRDPDEGPVQHIKISSAFYMGKYEITQKQWRAVMGTNPSNSKNDNLPIEQVSWNDALEFIKKLNEMEGLAKYRLPSETEWEYAARAGTTTRYSFGDDESKLRDYAWFKDDSGGETHEVGKKLQNPWGLNDMHGNLWEWVQDKYYGSYDGVPKDGSSLESGDSSLRVVRGGSWYYDAKYCRSAHRNSFDPNYRSGDIGFRLLRIL